MDIHEVFNAVKGVVNNFLDSGGWIVLLILLVILVFFLTLVLRKTITILTPTALQNEALTFYINFNSPNCWGSGGKASKNKQIRISKQLQREW